VNSLLHVCAMFVQASEHTEVARTGNDKLELVLVRPLNWYVVVGRRFRSDRRALDALTLA